MSMVKPSEMVHWKQLTLEYMTEESDDPDDSSLIVEHKLQWRSQSNVLLVKISLKYINFAAELEDFMQILDQRHETKAKKDKGTMAKKARKVGTPSSAPPPSGAPAWTLKPTG